MEMKNARYRSFIGELYNKGDEEAYKWKGPKHGKFRKLVTQQLSQDDVNVAYTYRCKPQTLLNEELQLVHFRSAALLHKALRSTIKRSGFVSLEG
jgi:poly(A) polymerase Pap1